MELFIFTLQRWKILHVQIGSLEKKKGFFYYLWNIDIIINASVCVCVCLCVCVLLYLCAYGCVCVCVCVCGHELFSTEIE